MRMCCSGEAPDCPEEDKDEDGGVDGTSIRLFANLGGLFIWVAIIYFAVRGKKGCAGWDLLEQQYLNTGGGDGPTFLGQPFFFRMKKASSSCVPVKFDRIMHVSASNTHLHLRALMAT